LNIGGFRRALLGRANKKTKGEKNIRWLKLAYRLAAATVLLGGMAIYFFFRDTKNMLLFRYLPNRSFLNGFYFPLKADSIWSEMFLFNLPYGLWCLSGLLFVRAVWLTDTKWGTFYRAIYIAIVMSYVFLKLPGITPGTFDILDLLFMAFFAFMESIFFNVFIRRKIV
jgi:hypothetical protein